MSKTIAELAKEHMRLRKGCGVSKDKYKERRKQVTCNNCGREMETIESENSPFFCWRCGDKLELGGYHEI